MRRSIRTHVAVILAVLALSSTHLFRGAPELDVTTRVVTAGPIARRITASGTLQAVTTVEIAAPEPGVVQTLYVDRDSPIHAGQILAQLDAASFRMALRDAREALVQAQADLRRLQAAVDEAQARLSREEDLVTEGLVARVDLDAPRAAVTQARMDLTSGEASAFAARMAVDQAAANLRSTEIRSPVDGVVLARNVDSGQWLSGTFQTPDLFRIATDLAHMELQATIDPSDVGAVHVGDPVALRVAAYPREAFHGTVMEVPTTRTGEIVGPTIIEVSNSDDKLRLGMTATVTLSGAHGDSVVRIPRDALSFHPSQHLFDVMRETNLPPAPASESGQRILQVWEYNGTELVPITVRTGFADDMWTELCDGPLRPGDQLVTSAFLADENHGQRTQVTPR